MKKILRYGRQSGARTRQVIEDLAEACKPIQRHDELIRAHIEAANKYIENKKAELFIKALRKKTTHCPIVSPELFRACSSSTSEHVYFRDELVIGFIHKYVPLAMPKPITAMGQDFDPVMEFSFPYRVLYEEEKQKEA